MGKLTIPVKGHPRSSFMRKGTRVDKAYVDKHKRTIEDVGKKGLGPKVIQIKRPGRFGEGFFSKPKEEQHAILSRDAKKYGEKSTMSSMGAISVFNKRVNKPLSREAAANKTWVADNFEGKIRVKTKR